MKKKFDNIFIQFSIILILAAIVFSFGVVSMTSCIGSNNNSSQSCVIKADSLVIRVGSGRVRRLKDVEYMLKGSRIIVDADGYQIDPLIEDINIFKAKVSLVED